MTKILQILLIPFLLLIDQNAQSMSEKKKSEIQTEIETNIKAFLSEQLEPGEFYVYALVTAEADQPNQPVTNQEKSVLPYSSVRVSNGLLEEILSRNIKQDKIDDYSVEVSLGLDQQISEAKRNLLVDIVQKRYGFGSEKRKLIVGTAEIVSAPVSGRKKLELEQARIESDKARLKLENEQIRLDVKKKELEILQLKSEHQKQVNLLKGDKEGDDETVGEEPAKSASQELQLSPEFALFKDLQPLMIGLMLAGALIFTIFLAGASFKRGLEPVSTAIEVIGSSIEGAAQSTAQANATAAASAQKDKQKTVDLESKDTEIVSSGQIEPMTADQEAFAVVIRDKIKVLSAEKNYSFFRVFADLMENAEGMPLAASILVSVDEQTSQVIVDEISLEQISRLKEYLSRPGALSNAKKLRGQALNYFYGRVAMDEFSNSPFVKMKNVGWLTKMSSQEMSAFVVSLSDKERPIFLACLSPDRTKMLLDQVSDTGSKDKILRSIAQIDTVKEDQIGPVIQAISERMNANEKVQSGASKNAVNSAQYLAKVASELSAAEQEKLFASITNNQKLLDDMRKFYVPFYYVNKLPKALIMEIFGSHTDEGIAQILLDSSEDIRNHVVNALPEIRAESVKDELQALTEDKFYEKRNVKLSNKLQKEISEYLKKLYSEGLLNLDEGASGVQDYSAA